jgi:hypothetical protein
MFKRACVLMLLAMTVALSACNRANEPYLAYAGVILAVHKDLPPNSTIEVSMDNPAGGAPIVMRQTPGSEKRIEFNTDALSGIVAKKDYKVTIRLLGADGTVLQTIDKTYQSDLDQSVLPPAPLTVGPGYTKNPAAPAQ